MTPARDPFIRGGVLTVRIGYGLSLVLGLLMLVRFNPGFTLLPVHVGAGVLLALGSLTLYLRTRTLGHESSRAAGVVLAALAVGAANGLMALVGISSGLLHLVIMLLTVVAAESVNLRLKRAG